MCLDWLRGVHDLCALLARALCVRWDLQLGHVHRELSGRSFASVALDGIQPRPRSRLNTRMGPQKLRHWMSNQGFLG
jgi:hypothetical protein